MERKGLHEVPYLDGVTLLTDRPNRRLGRSLKRLKELMSIQRHGVRMHEDKEREEAARRGRSDSRGAMVSLLKGLAKRGIYGLEFDRADEPDVPPFHIRWFRSSSWKIVDLARFLGSKAFRSNEAARAQVTISWTMDWLGPHELELLRMQFGDEFVAAAKVKIDKAAFQQHSGAKRPPVGVKEERITLTVVTEELWDEKPEDALDSEDSSEQPAVEAA